MAYDPSDTIAAIGTSSHGAARGMVRMSGPQVLDCLDRCFTCDDSEQRLEAVDTASVLPGEFHSELIGAPLRCELFLWPSARSYTRQPVAELHTLGSPPLLEAMLQEVCQCGARVAEPGEFTLRAFLAGRLDLTQAEAVLGVIDARGQRDLDTALSQLAGGLSRPLLELREQLVQILAELEAGLDFAEEDIQFIGQDELSRLLGEARQTVAAALGQMSDRAESSEVPRVALLGAPNVGKSSLFNSLVESSQAVPSTIRSIVSRNAGTTRDYVTAVVDFGGLVCELIDTAGDDLAVASDSIDHLAQAMTDEQRKRADLRLLCIEAANSELVENDLAAFKTQDAEDQLVVLTKSDTVARPIITTDSAVACSSQTGEGLDAVRQQIVRLLLQNRGYDGSTVATTAARCAESLRRADEALERSLDLCSRLGVEELIAAEVREALYHLGCVVGTVYTEDILDRVFSQFCIGK